MVGLATPGNIFSNILKTPSIPLLQPAALKPQPIEPSVVANPVKAPALPSALSVIKNTTAATGLGPLVPISTAALNAALGTARKMAQQYQYQVRNADGTLTTKTIPASELQQGTAQGFVAEQASTQLQQTEARLIDPGNTYTSAQRASILQDSLKVDYCLCIKSQDSLPLEFNNLQTPSLTSDLTYNFYEPNETDQASQEDQTKDPLLSSKTPARYVELKWDVVGTKDPSSDFASRTQAELQMVNNYLCQPRGTATLSNLPTVNSFESNLSQVNPIFKEGVALSLVDTHDMERGFNSTSNSRLFKNAALTTINVNNVDGATINLRDVLLDNLDG